jgi:predicted DNA-binding transcriptional regulator AlpA
LEIGLLSDKDLADMLGLNTNTLQIWRMEDRGPNFTKLGKQVFYRLADVQAWIQANVKVTETTAKTSLGVPA